MTTDRCLDDAHLVMEYAKLEQSEVLPAVQSLHFSPVMDNQAFKLMEVDESILGKLKVGERLVLRGEKNESAVLCTDSKTFEIKDAETSNSLLILEQCSWPDTLKEEKEQKIINRQVSAVLYNYYELRPVKPRLSKLKKLLEENQFSGHECEEDEEHKGKKYTYSDLQDLVQSSELELKTGLKRLKACKINDHIRMLRFDYLERIVNSIIQLCEENSWSTDEVPLEICVQELQEIYPRHLIEHVLSCYGKPRESQESTSDMEIDLGAIYQLNEDAICSFFAEMLLRAALGKFHLQEFLTTWQQSVPQGMSTSLAQIEGLALVDQDAKPEVIGYFPVEDLPEDVENRFRALFQVRPKWTLEEITPYIRDLATEKVGIGPLLIKYCRASMQNGIKVYNSKRPIN